MTKTTNLLQTAGNAATNEGLRDIKAPVAIASGWEWLWWTLGALAVAAVVAGLLRWWLKKRAAVPPASVLPPHVRARKKLAEALALIGLPEPFVVAVSGALRVYLEERLEFRAPERTTEEFLHELGDTPLLSARQKGSLGDFLTACDLVKFAKYEPGEAELRDLHGAALRLVDETVPVSDLAPAVPPPAPPGATARTAPPTLAPSGEGPRAEGSLPSTTGDSALPTPHAALR